MPSKSVTAGIKQKMLSSSFAGSDALKFYEKQGESKPVVDMDPIVKKHNEKGNVIPRKVATGPKKQSNTQNYLKPKEMKEQEQKTTYLTKLE